MLFQLPECIPSHYVWIDTFTLNWLHDLSSVQAIRSIKEIDFTMELWNWSGPAANVKSAVLELSSGVRGAGSVSDGHIIWRSVVYSAVKIKVASLVLGISVLGPSSFNGNMATIGKFRVCVLEGHQTELASTGLLLLVCLRLQQLDLSMSAA